MRSCVSRARHAAAAALLALFLGAPILVAQDAPASLFNDARAVEVTLRKEIAKHRTGTAAAPLVRRSRILISTYEDIARLFPQGGYADKSLWQGASLAADVFDVFKEAPDRAAAIRLSELLESRYPSSTFLAQSRRRVATLALPRPGNPPAAADQPAVPLPAVDAPGVQPRAASSAPAPAAKLAVKPVAPPPTPTNTLRTIRREALADVLRVSLELDHEVPFHDQRLDGPPRVFVDLQNTRAAANVEEMLAFDDDVVRQIRVGRQLDRRVRVVLDLADAPAHSIYTLYDPFRVVIDFERRREMASAVEAPRESTTVVAPQPADSRIPKPIVSADTPEVTEPVAKVPTIPPVLAATAPPAAAIASTTAARITTPAPAPVRDIPVTATLPPARLPTGLSMSRQLGLGVQRVVIDPGHGGYDPGAKHGELVESELVLDVALRLEQLLQKEGIEVVLTRRSNVYVALEERPAIALRQEADLYLSIHANASSDRRVRGVETYILNFAPNAQSAALAARENSGSARTMKSLSDIVKTIALNNKIDESRDLARQVQASLIEKLSKGNRVVRNLGVKQAPFAVLVGTDMPSILAEIGFITNKQDAALVKTAVYRQQIADALASGIVRYQKRLKPPQVAGR